MHASVLAAYLVCYAFLIGFAVTIGLHRGLSHRSFKMNRWLEYFLVTVGLPAGGPIQWVGTHRCHHRYADQDGDPHSPIRGGFWHAHIGGKYLPTDHAVVCFIYSIAGPLRMIFDGWYRPRSNQEYNAYARDIASVPYYRFLGERVPFFSICALHALITSGLAYWIWGAFGLIGIWLVQILVYNVGDGLSSFGHTHGERLPGEPHHARNHIVLGLLALGDGWHANHHSFPSSARHGLLAGQPDCTYGAIRILEKMGLVSQVKLPTPEKLREKLAHEPSHRFPAGELPNKG